MLLRGRCHFSTCLVVMHMRTMIRCMTAKHVNGFRVQAELEPGIDLRNSPLECFDASTVFACIICNWGMSIQVRSMITYVRSSLQPDGRD